MFKRTGKKTFFLVAVLVVIAAGFILPPVLIKNALLREMKAFGFSPVSIVASDTGMNRAIFSSIRLDRDGFSTIDNIVVQGGVGGIQSATIDNLVLTGEMDGWNFPQISGWKWPEKPMQDGNLTALDLNGGQLDILTPEGAIRLTSKAQMAAQPDGSRKIDAIVWGKQNQLIVDSRWDISLRPSGSGWTAAAEIREGRIDFEKFGASRLSGWVNIDSGKNSPFPLLSGQLAAGQLRLGKDTSLTNINMTIDSAGGKYHFILQGEVSPYKDMRLTADVGNLPGIPSIQAVIETKNLADLIDFISTLQNDLHDTKVGSSLLTSLLITPGNLERVEKEVRRTRYDHLELTVTGSPYDLVGKIVARQEKNGAMQRHIISLDPG